MSAAARIDTRFAAPCVVFDLDGTLLDTRDAMVSAVNEHLAKMRRRAVAASELTESTHEGLESMLVRALLLTGTSPDDVSRAALHRQVSANYLDSAGARVKPFPALGSLLDMLHQAGVWMAVCTNQLECHARRLLDTFAIAHYFQEVVGRDTFAARKPDPLPLVWLLGRCGVHPREALMVGDSEVDARCATAAGANVVLMQHGYGSPAATAQYASCRDFAVLRELMRVGKERPIEKSAALRRFTDRT